MKAFEEKYGALHSIQECQDDDRWSRKEGWRAALEWVLNFSEYDGKDAIRRTIEQELEDSE
ncbi:MAG: hypothetical protein GY938_30625 [Ketobacter sp.]|nr:hypothetical protein [Ketobacter sp.]